MEGKSQPSALVLMLLSATFIVQSVYAYENTQYGFSITPPEGWTLEENMETALFVFRDPSNYTGATIRVVVNQSGMPQDEAILWSRIYLMRYLGETYSGYLITERGASGVGNLNGYQIKFNASVGGSEMRFDSAILIETNQTFYIVC